MRFRRLILSQLQAKWVRFYSAKPSEPVPDIPATDIHTTGPIKVTKLPNGVFAASMETVNPLVYVTIAMKAGSRYEDGRNNGISHCLRHCFGLSTRKFSSFKVIRHLELMGAELTAENSREFMTYKLTCHRNRIREALLYLVTLICDPKFYPWELKHVDEPMRLDIANYEQNPFANVFDGVNKAAFRGGLGNSIFASKEMLGKYTEEMLHKFMKDNFAANRTAFGAVGMPHDAAIEYAGLLKFPSTESHHDIASVYVGGDYRNHRVMPYSHVMIANHSLGYKNHKELATYSVIQHMLGTNPTVRGRCGRSRLAFAIHKVVTEGVFAVNTLNHSYTDAGLFAIYLSAPGELMGRIVQTVFEELNAIKTGVSEEELRFAKVKAAANKLLGFEHSHDLSEDLAFNALQHGKGFDPAYWVPLFNSITISDVNSVINKMASGNLTIGAMGNLCTTPYVEDLRART